MSTTTNQTVVLRYMNADKIHEFGVLGAQVLKVISETEQKRIRGVIE